MQIKSKNDCMVIDYYPIMTPTKKLLANYRLRVLTFIGQTQNKEIISEKEMMTDRELLLKDGSFKISCQTNRPPQLMTFTEVK
tara:strand:+ start:436 stop:684 length:249 start_codon:yes stop_codon:yes gene_type:complete